MELISKFAIQVESLGKEYIIGGAEQRHDTFREMLTGALTSPLRKMRKLGGKVGEEERFWALKDISFDVKQGEVLGVIGRNGAGKSTLLKVLSRITSPTEGRVVTRGRVSSLLEVGTGFHPELTGRENIYLNGAILGMSRTEIDRCFDQIVDFAEIDKFLDTPVKRYSSGMYVRLAFAVAAHLDADILIIDEVLAVGDQTFQKKCLGKMGDVSRSGKTVLFVSHNMQAISTLTEKAIILENGHIEFLGSSSEAISRYLEHDESVPHCYIAAKKPGKPCIMRVEVFTSEPAHVHHFGQELVIEFDIHAPEQIKNASLSFQLVDIHGVPITHLWIFDSEQNWGRQAGQHSLRCVMANPLLYMGKYSMNVYLSEGDGGKKFETLTEVCPFEIVMHGISRDFKWYPGTCRYLEQASWSAELIRENTSPQRLPLKR